MTAPTTAPPRFLVEHVASLTRAHERPHITLTWAQSLDAKLAGPGGARVMLSGPESMLMTHWWVDSTRAILTQAAYHARRDPGRSPNRGHGRPAVEEWAVWMVSLTPVQLVPQDDPSLLPPQPLILDPKLRMPTTARILSEWREHGSKQAAGPLIVRQPWIICGTLASESAAAALEQAGARIVRTELDSNGHIPPTSLPHILQSLNLRSVMIEGGSRVLSTFLHAGKRPDGSDLVDSVVVTVAPMFIGEGISVVPAVSEHL